MGRVASTSFTMVSLVYHVVPGLGTSFSNSGLSAFFINLGWLLETFENISIDGSL